jgi:hypothetical protein
LSVKSAVRELLQSAARRLGYDLVPTRDLFDYQRSDYRPAPGRSDTMLNPSDAHYLVASNPRLLELQTLYRNCDIAATEPRVWTAAYASGIALASFRGDNAYLWQGRRGIEIHYALTTYYLMSNDPLGLLDRLTEDGAYGCQTFDIDQRVVSRDLLDSVRELSFLAKYTGIAGPAPPCILDIGAGYGRLAHRCITAFPAITRYYCMDAVPESSFLCEFYLAARRLGDRAHMLPLTSAGELSGPDLDLAINVHAFSECSVAAIKWWLGFLVNKRVRQLFVVPNRVSADRTRMLTNYDADLSAIVESFGYVLRQCEPKFASPVMQQYGLCPAYYFLYELSGR